MVRLSCYILLLLGIFIGLGAIVGAFMMISSPSGASLGLDSLLDNLSALPLSEVLFKDYFFAGLLLGLLIGVPQLLSSFSIWKGMSWAPWLVLFSGLVLLAWIGVQLLVFPMVLLHAFYLLLALIEVGLAVYLIL